MPRQLIPAYEVIYDRLGTGPAAGGSIQTYEVGTTDDKLTTADYDGLIPNENPVPLDSSGRVETPIWGDGAFTLVIRSADGEVIKTLESRPEQSAGLTIPALVSEFFLTNDGSQLLWEAIRQVPDPTGFSGRVLTNDGENMLWSSLATLITGLIPDPPAPDIAVATQSFTAGGGGTLKVLIQWGQDTAPASGAYQTTKAVTYPTAYKSGTVPFVVTTPAPGAQPAGPAVPFLSAPATSTGFTAGFDAAESGSPREVLNPVVFQWLSIGVIDAA